MTHSSPVVTVVVPLYNTQRYIRETLASLEAQTFRDFEVVIVDDASTDQGPEIAAEFVARDTRFRIIRQENRGLAGARNSGIREARGRYIALLDADDAFLAEKLGRHVAHLEASPGVGVSYAASQFIDDDSRPMGLSQEPRLTGVDPDHIFCRNPVGNGSAAVLRRAALDDVAFEIETPEGLRTCWFDESFRQSEDIEMWCRIAATTNWTFEGIAGALTLYRVNTSGLSANTDKQFETWSRFRNKLAGIAPDLVARAGARAESYQYRYLARRAAVGGDGRKAFALTCRALKLYPKMILEEPGRTAQTIAVSIAAALLGEAVFTRMKAGVMRRSGHPAKAHERLAVTQ